MSRVQKKPEAEERFSANQLAAKWGKSERTVRDILHVQRVRAVNGGKYELDEATRGLIAHFEGKLAEKNSEQAETKKSKSRAEAELAEIELAEKKGELMLKSDVSKIWREGLVGFSAVIQGASYIPKKDRERLVSEMKAAAVIK